MPIQWFPGHMAKAQKEIKQRLKLVDIIFEIIDARAPLASINPMIEKLGENRPIILILNKSDLADPVATKAFMAHFKTQGMYPIALDAQHHAKLPEIEKLTRSILADKIAAKKARGLKNPVVRAMCVGVPNVGKSTILNRLAQKNIAITGNKPGVTKGQQWLKVGQSLELLDTPGVLWPKFEDAEIGYKLALTGAIADKIFHADDVVVFSLNYFKQFYRENLKKAYQLTDEDLEMPTSDLILFLTKKTGFKDDYEQFCIKFIVDARKGRLGKFTLDIAPIEVQANADH